MFPPSWVGYTPAFYRDLAPRSKMSRHDIDCDVLKPRNLCVHTYIFLGSRDAQVMEVSVVRYTAWAVLDYLRGMCSRSFTSDLKHSFGIVSSADSLL